MSNFYLRQPFGNPHGYWVFWSHMVIHTACSHLPTGICLFNRQPGQGRRGEGRGSPWLLAAWIGSAAPSMQLRHAACNPHGTRGTLRLLAALRHAAPALRKNTPTPRFSGWPRCDSRGSGPGNRCWFHPVYMGLTLCGAAFSQYWIDIQHQSNRRTPRCH